MRRLIFGLLILLSSHQAVNAYKVTAEGQQEMWNYVSTSCAEFTEAFEDEKAARARKANPEPSSFYTPRLANMMFQVSGLMSGINAERQGKPDFFFQSMTIMRAKLAIECAKTPERNLLEVVMSLAH